MAALGAIDLRVIEIQVFYYHRIRCTPSKMHFATEISEDTEEKTRLMTFTLPLDR